MVKSFADWLVLLLKGAFTLFLGRNLNNDPVVMTAGRRSGVFPVCRVPASWVPSRFSRFPFFRRGEAAQHACFSLYTLGAVDFKLML